MPALERGLSVLEMMVKSSRGVTLSEVSRKLALPKSSTHLILTTLERRGYLQKDNHTRRYRLGLKLVGLSRTAIEHLQLREEAWPFLQSLMHKTGFCAHLAVLEGNEAILIKKVNAPGPYRITTTWAGQRVPAHCTGIGKAMIAHLSNSEFDRHIGSTTLWKYNKNTIILMSKLKKDLRETRERGYSVSNEESQIGFRGIGAPVFDPTGKVVAGISVDGSALAIPAEVVPSLGRVVQQTAAAISAYLAHGNSLVSPSKASRIPEGANERSHDTSNRRG